MTGDHDAIVIGAGPNGLVAANRLADAGWSVVLLEAQPRVGGAVASDRAVHPAFVHDTFSSFYPLAAASATIQSFDLERHGLGGSTHRRCSDTRCPTAAGLCCTATGT